MLKKFIFTIYIILSAFLVSAQDFPERSNTLVTDYTNTLSAQEKAALEKKLVAFNDSTSTQIAVVIISSVGSYDISQYALQLGRKWGIGNKGKNNGILLLVALNDRKVTIQTGYGAEGAVPDIIAHDIIKNDIAPFFKGKFYYEGIDAGTTSLMKYMKGEYKADAPPQQQTLQPDGGINIGIIVFIIILALIFIFRNVGGGGGHIIGSRGASSPFWWFLMGSALGGGSNDSGGGFFGGDGGGSGSGGGFGGFGGGSFGGGGSSGNW